MDGRTVAALVIGLITGYILTRAMQQPTYLALPATAPPPAPAPTQTSSAPQLVAASRTVTPSIDSLAS